MGAVSIVVPAHGDVDPGKGKRIKYVWYHTKKHGVSRWLGREFSCKHGRWSTNCKECNSKIVCVHEILRGSCKECNSKAFCMHEILRYNCKVCNSKIVCDHEIRRHDCKVCNSKIVCMHEVRRKSCKVCNSKVICMHEVRRNSCKVCNSKGFCMHEIRRYSCKVCNSKLICDHEIRRSDCKVCNSKGFCPHELQHRKCKACLLNSSVLAEKATSKANRCNECATELDPKRRESKGGIGICSACEKQKKKEAHANGSAPPPKGASWETNFFSKLLPLVTYADGTPFPPDQRDQREGGGLGTSKSKKRRRECDTTTNRFPDCMHIRRDEDGHATLVVVSECDEHSHGHYKPACESGKIDDEFQSVQTFLNDEGAARTARTGRFGARMVPIVFVKTNPNAYDGPRTGLDDRIKATAALINSYVHLPASEIESLQTEAPIVRLLYYHSKEGGANLAHFATHAPGADWDYKNGC